MRKRQISDIAVVVGIALCIRVAYLAIFGGFDNQLHDSMTDQHIYLDIAQNLAAGNGFVVSTDIWVADAGEPTSIMPPLYPTMLGAIFTFTGDSFFAARILNLALSGLLAMLAYLIGGRIMDRRGALLAGMLVALYPPLVMYVRPIMSESLFLPLVALLAYLTLHLLEAKPSLLIWIAWGGVAALAVLTRTEAGFLVIALMAFVVTYKWYRTRTLPVVRALVALVAFGFILSPYSIYNFTAHGSVLPLPNAKWKMWDHTWWADTRTRPEWEGVTLPERIVVPDWDGKTERERDEFLARMTVNFIRDHPETYGKQRLGKVYWSYPLIPVEEFRPQPPPDGSNVSSTSLDDVVRYSSMAEKIRGWSFRLAFVGAAAALILGFRRKEILLLGSVVAWNVLHSAFFVGSERLRLQIDLFLVVLTVMSLVAVWDSVMDRSTRRRWDGDHARAPVST